MHTTDDTLQLLLDALSQGATLVTVNNRLARHTRSLLTRRAAERQSVWPAPDILPWGGFLRRLWAEASALDPYAPLLLDPAQSVRLWQDIIDADAPELLQSTATARLAAKAWALLQDWRLSLPFDAPECNDDVLHFQRWAERFAKTCRQKGWLDEACLPHRLGQALASGRLKPPSHILLLGFEDWTPAEEALLEAMVQRGTRLQPLPGLTGRGAAQVAASAQSTAQLALPLEDAEHWGRLDFPDPASEDAAAARWARAMLERQPGARLAIIAPDLGARRARLIRLLDAMLTPSALLPGHSDAPRLWNISLGLPLLEHGLVRAAFLAMDLGEETLPLETLSQALRSPFLGGHAAERDARALLDARLREQGERRFTSSWVRRLAAEQGCPRFAELLKRLHEQRKAWPRQASPVAWAEGLRETLHLAGWPGDVPLDSASFRLRQAWLELFDQLARLEVVRPQMNWHEALAQLRGLAGESLFQPEAVAEAPVQVLGPLEAVGLGFDAVWLMSMHHEQWPPLVQPNPFLPMRLQARLGMPHASPQRELAYLRRISQRLMELAPAGVVSHPRQDEGRELEPSPLFSHLPVLTALPAMADLPGPESWGAGEALESWTDGAAPPFTAGEMAPGGSRLLELQSACPFRAFAELRLEARPLEEPALGPDPRVRGVLLHALLERVWGELGDHAGLLAHADDALRARVQGHAQEVVAKEARRHPHLWPTRLQSLEVERMTGLVLQWLSIERTRVPFTVESREQRSIVALAGLKLEIKLDRVDRLEDGRRLVMDYKSGRVSPSDWLGERLRAPQLPLYVISEADIHGVALAQVRAGEMRLMGLGDQVAGLKPAEPDWSAQKASWQAVLTQLAEDFRQGRAAVDPRDAQVCRHCPLGMLCRIHELAGNGPRMEEDQDD